MLSSTHLDNQILAIFFQINTRVDLETFNFLDSQALSRLLWPAASDRVKVLEQLML